MMHKLFLFCGIFALFFSSCKPENTSQNTSETPQSTGPTRFEMIKSEVSGVNFVNNLVETPELNVFNYLYFYNGGGAATGDLNGDGLADLMFTSNQEQPKLYLNGGNFKFNDITQAAGIEIEKGWTTGVTFADINADGRLDIYVSRVGGHPGIEGHNLLYINKGVNAAGIPSFSEEAHLYGLELRGYSTQAAFFDYDLDGDLDLYMLRHSVHSNGTFGTKGQLRNVPHPLAGDKLMRNDGPPVGGKGGFTDVTIKAGIYSAVTGYGLGVVTGDVNLDGLPDIYIGNDFHEDDFLYLNNGNGTFREVLNDAIGHTSRYTMGTDIGDFNNDGLPDILTLDMLPEDPKILKSSAAEEPFDIYEFKLNYGYNHQYARNNLQMNAGILPQKNGQNDVLFTEMSCFAGIYATDWSWSGLFCDLDLDGWRDIYISNGIMRRSNDLDYTKFVEVDSIQMRMHQDGVTAHNLKMIKLMPSIKIPNFAYKNNGKLGFIDQSAAWGLNQKTFSNGSVYADFDNDGDLDLAVNNLNEVAFVFKNKTIDGGKSMDDKSHFLKFTFKGTGQNPNGIGAKVVYRSASGAFTMQENFPTRGYQSSMEPNQMIIGIGERKVVDSVFVVWPRGEFELLKNVNTDQFIVSIQSSAKGKFDPKILLPKSNRPVIFADITNSAKLNWKHIDPKFVEFNRERLIPNMNSTEGPKLAIGDANGDGLEDFFVGGGKRQPAKLFFQNKMGDFQSIKIPEIEKDSVCEDIGAQFFDADGDKDVDLVVVSGGNEFKDGNKELQPRLYLNDGKGQFSRKTDAFGDLSFNGGAVAINDFDLDGDADIFFGGRSIPWNYGLAPVSFLMENLGNGVFKNSISQKAPTAEKCGFVKSAIWQDLDKDGWDDLVLAGDWMPISIFWNKKGRLEASKNDGLDDSNGWWNCVEHADLDGDGDEDLVAGNYGLNSKMSGASAKNPLRLYAADFDKNQSIDQLLTYNYKGIEILFATKDELQQQIPSIKKKYLDYSAYASAKAADFFGQKALDQSNKWIVKTLASAWIENLGGGKFLLHELPTAAQFSAIQSIRVRDFDGNGKKDLVLVGNYFDANPEIGRLDGNYGTVLLNFGKNDFRALPMSETGLAIKGQCRDLAFLPTKKGDLMLVARNAAAILVYRLEGK
jgi:enediyne biosynthesis protein E4